MVKAIENLRKRKLTGGRRKPSRQRMLSEKDSYSTECVLGEYQSRRRRMRGGGIKIILDATNKANVIDPVTNKISNVSLISVVSNPSNRDYNRRGVITKGAVIETELGKAKVLSRPGQDGMVNAILVK
ncbi:MAG: 30S ribosomal protein S8e [Nitrososphaerales archaeon]